MKTLQLIFLSTLLLSGCHQASSPEEELGVMIHKVSSEFSDVPQISTSDLAAWLADPARVHPQLLDVREPNEYAVSHLAGAIRVSPDATADQLSGKIDFSKPTVLYCSVGYRSSNLAHRLISGGVKKPMNLEGSIFKWSNEGRPLVSDAGPTRSVHPYNRKFGRMLRTPIQNNR